MFSACLDTNALYPQYVRDLLLDFAQSDFYKPVWSQKILEELSRNLTLKLPEKAISHKTLLRLMEELFPDANTSGFEHLEGTLGCFDENDEHVLAAAIVAKAGAVVTFNHKDFPSDMFEKFGIELVSPDDFLLDLADLNERAAIVTVARRLDMYSRPTLQALELATCLKNSNCHQFADWVAAKSEEIDSTFETLRIARNGI